QAPRAARRCRSPRRFWRARRGRGMCTKSPSSAAGRSAWSAPPPKGRPPVGFPSSQFGVFLGRSHNKSREPRGAGFGEPSAATRGIETRGAKKLEEIRIVDPVERYTLDEYLASLARDVRAEIDRVVTRERTRLGLRRVLDDWFAHLAETQADGD